MLKLKLKTNFYGELCLKDCKENIWFLMTYFNMVFILQYYSLFFLSFSLLTRSLNSFQWVLKYAWPILALWLIRGCIWPYFVNKLTLWVTPNFFRGQNKIKTDSCRNICIASSITAGTRGCMIFFFLVCQWCNWYVLYGGRNTAYLFIGTNTQVSCMCAIKGRLLTWIHSRWFS